MYLNLYLYLNLCNESTSVCDHVPHNSISFSWQACTWRLTAMAKMVAVHWLVRLNSLMHVAGAGLLSQHGWDTGYSCLSAAHTHTQTLISFRQIHRCLTNIHKLTHAHPETRKRWTQQYDVTKRAEIMSPVRVWPQGVMWIHICLNSCDTWLRREYVVMMVFVFRNQWPKKAFTRFTCTKTRTLFLLCLKMHVHFINQSSAVFASFHHVFCE